MTTNEKLGRGLLSELCSRSQCCFGGSIYTNKTFMERKRVCCLVLICSAILTPSVFDTAICPQNQTAELGGQGQITCNFPDNYDEVYWFDNVSDSSYPIITFKPKKGVKNGRGLEAGAYDVYQDGSLIIKKVTTWHEREYKVVVYIEGSLIHNTFFVSVKVTASPGDQCPMVHCYNCYEEYYYTLTEKETLSCSFDFARPPVLLEWFEKFPERYDSVEMQNFSSTKSRNGTFTSSTTLFFLRGSSDLIHLFSCKATWFSSDWRREKEILVDFSSNKSFTDVIPKIQYMEVNKHAKISCGQLATVYVVWKRIVSNNELEIIGFHSHVMTETITTTPDVKVSAGGSLTFSSPQVHHEGTYACIYGDGQKEGNQMTTILLLIPPSPPYIQIIGCDDVSHGCVFNSTKKITCAVYGVRPTATLEWIADDKNAITLFNRKVVRKERGETSDTVLSVEYKVSQDVLCSEEILIRCHLHGPLSLIMKAESTALVIPASCKEGEVKGQYGLHGFVILWGVPYIVLLVGCAIFCICRLRTSSTTTANAICNDDVTNDPQDTSQQTGSEEPAGNLSNGISLQRVRVGEASFQTGNEETAGHTPHESSSYFVEDTHETAL